MARESTPFRDRDPAVIGGISLGVILLLVLLAFNTASLPVIGGGTVYRAQFSEVLTKSSYQELVKRIRARVS